MISADEIPLEIARMVQGDVYKLPQVRRWLDAANETPEIQALRKAFAPIQKRRENEGKWRLASDAISLVSMSADYLERNCKNATEYKRLASLQRKAAKVLGVPCGESSLLWMIASET